MFKKEFLIILYCKMRKGHGEENWPQPLDAGLKRLVKLQVF